LSRPLIVTTFFDLQDKQVERVKTAGVAKILYKPTLMNVIDEEVRRCLSPIWSELGKEKSDWPIVEIGILKRVWVDNRLRQVHLFVY
jgi:hypothetical protein